MHQTQWSPERPLPPPVSLASQSHHEKPPEVTCTSRGNPGFPASTRERRQETFFNTSRGQIPLPFYDVLHRSGGQTVRLKARSLVGLIPLLAVETIEPDLLEALSEFRGRMQWFLTNRPHLAALVSRWHEPGSGDRRLLALARGHRMKRLRSE